MYSHDNSGPNGIKHLGRFDFSDFPCTGLLGEKRIKRKPADLGFFFFGCSYCTQKFPGQGEPTPHQ